MNCPHLVAAIACQRVARLSAVTEPELELVARTASTGKCTAAEIDRVPSLRVFGGDVRAVRDVVVEVDATGFISSSDWIKPVAPSVPGILAIHEEVRAERVIVLNLPESVQRMQNALVRIEIPLVPEERVRLRARHARRTAELLLGAIEIEPGHLIVLGRRPIDLRVRVGQHRPVARLIQADDADVVAAP